MADSLIDVGLGNGGGEEIACLKVAERAWQENFPDKGEEKRASGGEISWNEIADFFTCRSFAIHQGPREARFHLPLPLPLRLPDYFRPRRISAEIQQPGRSVRRKGENTREYTRREEKEERRRRRRRIVIVARSSFRSIVFVERNFVFFLLFVSSFVVYFRGRG